MDFALTAPQADLRQTIVRFARQELNAGVIEDDRHGAFSRDMWQQCAAHGIQGLSVPEEYGGSDLDPLSTAVALEALGYGCINGGLLFSLNAQMWSCQHPILRFGREDQRRRYLPGLCDGSLIGVQAMTEPASGSDAFSLRTSAERRGDCYVLNGSKTFITNAPVADVFVVFARTDPSKGFAGVSAFLLDRDAPGLVVGKPLHKMGLRTSPMSELVFEDCQISADQMLGGAGAGLTIFTSSMDWERTFILACAVGTMQRQVERCVAHAKERTQFGQPIGKFQAVSHRIAEMHLRVEAARLLLYKTAWMKGQRRSTVVESAMVKLHLSESFLQSSLDAVRVFGGYGYMAEYELERELRDAVGGCLYSGTSDIQRSIIAGGLGL